MTIDLERVCELAVLLEGGGFRLGSAHCVGRGLFLTAKHVIHGADGDSRVFKSAWVRHLDGSDKRITVTPWWVSPTDDICALRDVDYEPTSLQTHTVRWGLYQRMHKVPGEFCGFPEALSGISPGREAARESWKPHGYLDPHACRKSGLIAFFLDIGQVPESAEMIRGVSGAALFARGRLVGIVSKFATGFGTKLALAVPARTLLEDSEFANAIGATVDDAFPVDEAVAHLSFDLPSGANIDDAIAAFKARISQELGGAHVTIETTYVRESTHSEGATHGRKN